MKVAVTGDWHVGCLTYGVLDPKGRNSRLKDVEATVKKIYEYCRDNQVDLLVHAGDVFHTNKPTPDEQLIFYSFLMAMSQANVPVRVIIGNHDYNSQLGKADALKLFRKMKIPGVKIYAKTDAEVIGDCNYIFFPYAGDEPDFKSCLQVGMPNILVCHSHLEGALVGAEPFEIKDDRATKFKELPVNAVFAGHFHKPQVLSREPLAFYPGSIQAVDFNERMDVKGIVVVDTDTMKYTPVGFKTRKLYQIDLEGIDDPIEPHLQHCAEAIVKVNLKVAEADAHRIDEERLRELIIDADAHTIASINIDVVREVVKRDPQIKIDAGVKSNFIRFLQQRDYGDLSSDIEKVGCEIIEKCAT